MLALCVANLAIHAAASLPPADQRGLPNLMGTRIAESPLLLYR
jgi:hypothetical protein